MRVLPSSGAAHPHTCPPTHTQLLPTSTLRPHLLHLSPSLSLLRTFPPFPILLPVPPPSNQGHRQPSLSSRHVPHKSFPFAIQGRDERVWPRLPRAPEATPRQQTARCGRDCLPHRG
ncbi:hypothetical protein E2C01_008013 [Portunus trituberculatus]|uniref:Uncharacterized protein n=1 Tax=Portunus trituberculatus TaxID=210409 RepID=A0A5B7D0N5_PORTR|nr:hypothetical protein [Portunus trituberculatus]